MPAPPSQPSARRLIPWAIPPLAALLAVLPMLLHGQSCGHDFDFHLLSWLEAASQLSHANYPHWAYTPAFNAGEPRFLFYPPLSWLLGGLLGLLLQHLTATTVAWNAAPIVFIWITLSLAGCTFYHLARRYNGTTAALLAAVCYLANPYMLFTVYERSAFAELLAAAWLPLLLAAALPASQPGSPPPANHPVLRNVPRIALPLALIWLTNAPAAVMFTYALAFLTVARLLIPAAAPSGRLRLAAATGAGTALGLALAAFYILPAAFERRFVQISMVVMEGMRVNDHFLFHRMSGHTSDDLFHDAVVRTASWVAVGLLTAVLAVLALAFNRPHRAPLRRPILLPLALLAAVIALLLTPLSLPLWHLLPQMQYLQFPWRLSSLLGAIFALGVALALPPRLSLRTGLAAALPLAVAALLVSPAYTRFHQACDAEDAVPARVALFHSTLGTEPTDEYTPAAADQDALHPGDPPFWLLPAAADINTPPAPGAPAGPAPPRLNLQLTTPAWLILNRRSYPQWSIERNHIQVTSECARDDGLLALHLPAGPNQIDMQWHDAPDQLAGDALSVLALICLAATAIANRRSRHALAATL